MAKSAIEGELLLLVSDKQIGKGSGLLNLPTENCNGRQRVCDSGLTGSFGCFTKNATKASLKQTGRGKDKASC